MKHTTQLLCTFTSPDQLASTIAKIQKTYTIAFDSIYVLECVDDASILCCTYNIDTSKNWSGTPAENTISVHRKKATGTIYTINALNILIEELNGQFDPKFPVPWDDLKNCVLVTAYGHLKKIETKLQQIVKLNETK